MISAIKQALDALSHEAKTLEKSLFSNSLNQDFRISNGLNKVCLGVGGGRGEEFFISDSHEAIYRMLDDT